MGVDLIKLKTFEFPQPTQSEIKSKVKRKTAVQWMMEEEIYLLFLLLSTKFTK